MTSADYCEIIIIIKIMRRYISLNLDVHFRCNFAKILCLRVVSVDLSATVGRHNITLNVALYFLTQHVWSRILILTTLIMHQP